MDRRSLDATRAHYNRHSHATSGSLKESLWRRQTGPALPLKKFHNRIKACLIHRFGYGVKNLLDLCCGRGGDIHKWHVSKIGYVKGIDLSHEEVLDAWERYNEHRQKNRDSELECEFEATDSLGLRKFTDGAAPYDVVSCFFSIHYFMACKDAIHTLLYNVSMNLKKGGYFFGACPDGKKVVSMLQQAAANGLLTQGTKGYLKTDFLTLKPMWEGNYSSFGSAYCCAIRDTVTEGHDGSESILEYLVFCSVLVHVAAKFGLKLVKNYEDPTVDELFVPEDENEGFKHFKPNFPNSHESLEQASSLNMAFVFQKVVDFEDGMGFYLHDLDKYETKPPQCPPPLDKCSERPARRNKRRGEDASHSRSPRRRKYHHSSHNSSRASNSYLRKQNGTRNAVMRHRSYENEAWQHKDAMNAEASGEPRESPTGRYHQSNHNSPGEFNDHSGKQNGSGDVVNQLKSYEDEECHHTNRKIVEEDRRQLGSPSKPSKERDDLPE